MINRIVHARVLLDVRASIGSFSNPVNQGTQANSDAEQKISERPPVSACWYYIPTSVVIAMMLTIVTVRLVSICAHLALYGMYTRVRTLHGPATSCDHIKNRLCIMLYVQVLSIQCLRVVHLI